jgi:hypothetical protein
VAVVVALALGVLAAALVKLAGDSGPAPAPLTRTVTTAAATPGVGTTASTPATPRATATPTVPSATATTPPVPSVSVPRTATAPALGGGASRNTKAGKGRLRGLKAK